MSTRHIETRRKLKQIPLTADFESILQSCTVSDEDKDIMRRHYIQRQDLAFIGDALGYTERAMKDRHKKILQKIYHAL